METGPSLILRYARKIYGFAYSKTKNCHDAEDLSQDILVQLFDRRADFSGIENVDAYIWRICFYTWSNYLRKNKPAWNALDGADALELLPSDDDAEGDLLRGELYERLRREVMYLSGARREVTVMFYFENKSGREIAEALGIPASTVRWHLRESKIKLKERMEMTEQNGIYTPVKLSVGHSGWVSEYGMSGLVSDVITQNICWLCKDRPLTAEEIARTLGIASVYLEDKLEKLLYMDYLRTAGNGRYQTTFFIPEPEYITRVAELKYEYAQRLAEPLFNMLKDSLLKSREKLTFDGEFSDDLFLSALLMPELSRVSAYLSGIVCREKNLSCVTPKRRDGSAHWVNASRLPGRGESCGPDASDGGFADFFRNRCGPVKTRDCGSVMSMQYDLAEFGGWRDFETDDLKRMERVHDLSLSGEAASAYDKDAIASLAAKGYVRVEDGRPVILVPYLRKIDLKPEAVEKGLEKWRRTLDEHIDVRSAVDMLSLGVERMERFIPKYLDKNERDCHLSGAAWAGDVAIMYMFFKKGLLKTPDKNEMKRVCTYIWEK